MASEKDLEIIESPRAQGAGEVKTYTLTATPWGSDPSAVAIKVETYINGVYADVTADVALSSPSVVGDVITFSLGGLTAGIRYRTTITFESGSDTNTPFLWIDCTK